MKRRKAAKDEAMRNLVVVCARNKKLSGLVWVTVATSANIADCPAMSFVFVC